MGWEVLLISKKKHTEYPFKLAELVIVGVEKYSFTYFTVCLPLKDKQPIKPTFITWKDTQNTAPILMKNETSLLLHLLFPLLP